MELQQDDSESDQPQRFGTLKSVVERLKPGPKIETYGKILINYTTNLILPAVDEVSDLISGINYLM